CSDLPSLRSKNPYWNLTKPPRLVRMSAAPAGWMTVRTISTAADELYRMNGLMGAAGTGKASVADSNADVNRPADGIAARLAVVRAEIAEAAQAAERDPRSVALVAVGKMHGAAAVEAAIVAGQRIFGENRVQEAKAKFPALKAKYPDLELHLIGPLQTNKVRDAVALFDVIETVDRPKLAERLAQEIRNQNRRVT